MGGSVGSVFGFTHRLFMGDKTTGTAQHSLRNCVIFSHKWLRKARALGIGAIGMRPGAVLSVL